MRVMATAEILSNHGEQTNWSQQCQGNLLQQRCSFERKKKHNKLSWWLESRWQRQMVLGCSETSYRPLSLRCLVGNAQSAKER